LEERDEVRRILAALSGQVRRHLEDLRTDQRIIAEMDAAAAVAEEEEGNENVSRRERRPKTARRERIQKEDEEALKARVTSKFMKDDDE
nr:hypothetical protein [Bacteroidales bacterium]